MVNRILFFLVLLCLWLNGHGQKYFLGVESGVNYSKMLFFQSKYYSFSNGYMLGFNVDKPLTNSFFLQGGFWKSEKAFESDKTIKKWNSVNSRTELFNTRKSFTGQYYEGQVLFGKYYKGFVFSFGAKYSYLGDYDYSETTDIYYKKELIGYEDEVTEIQSGVNKSNINVVCKTGYRLNNGFGINLNMELATLSFSSDFKWQNMFSVGASVSYTFQNRKYIDKLKRSSIINNKEKNYRILKYSATIDRISFIQKSSAGDKILFVFEQNGMLLKDMPELSISGSSGVMEKRPEEVGFYFVEYPFYGKVTYFKDDDMDEKVELEFEILKPGDWEVRIKTRNNTSLYH